MNVYNVSITHIADNHIIEKDSGDTQEMQPNQVIKQVGRFLLKCNILTSCAKIPDFMRHTWRKRQGAPQCRPLLCCRRPHPSKLSSRFKLINTIAAVIAWNYAASAICFLVLANTLLTAYIASREAICWILSSNWCKFC